MTSKSRHRAHWQRVRLAALVMVGVLALPAMPATPAHSIAAGQTITNDVSWLVQVFADRTAKEQFRCSGALVDAEWVLTAAHCVYDDFGFLLANNRVKLRIGDRDLTQGEAASVNLIVRHNDSALLHLSRASAKSPAVVLRRPEATSYFDDASALWAYGWGCVGAYTCEWPPSGTLKRAKLRVTESQPFMPHLLRSKRRSESGSGEARPGDSGGPWVVATPWGSRVIGTTTAHSCEPDCSHRVFYGSIVARGTPGYSWFTHIVGD